MKAIAVMFLAWAVLAGCTQIPPPDEPSLWMNCWECGRFTSWVAYCEEYMKCTVSGTRW